jgi:hypothetical protein
VIDAEFGTATPLPWQVYVPVLRLKSSEWKAMLRLGQRVRARCRPLIEFVPEWKPPVAKAPGKVVRKARAPQTPKAYLDQMLQRTVEMAKGGIGAFLDFGNLESPGEFHGIDVWAAFCGLPNVTNSGVIPTTCLTAGTALRARIKPAVVHAGARLGIRIPGTAVAKHTVEPHLSDMIKELGVTPNTTHLLIDLKDTPELALHASVRSAVAQIGEYASVTVLGGVFPIDLTKYDSKTALHKESRVEWLTWWREHGVTAAGQRLLAFGDYTTQHAHYKESPGVAGSVSLRYTTDDTTLVLRGKQADSAAGVGFDQMHGHCRFLTQHKDFSGATFSAGDHKIHCWREPQNGPGNPEQWRTASVTHHITHVVAQLMDGTGCTTSMRTIAKAQPPMPCAQARLRKGDAEA